MSVPFPTPEGPQKTTGFGKSVADMAFYCSISLLPFQSANDFWFATIVIDRMIDDNGND